MEGCVSKAKARDLCTKHGAYGACKAIAPPMRRAVAIAESMGGEARVLLCAIADGISCARHGANGICAADGCTRNARTGKKVCHVHSTDKKPCTVTGCTSYAVVRGRCRKHDGNRMCSTAGCDTAIKARGLCARHGAMGFCSANNCTTAALARGLCRLHGGGSTKLCTIKGCTTRAVARSLCGKHGVNGRCQFEGCTTMTTSPRGGSQHCIRHGGTRKKPCSVAGCQTLSARKGLCGKHSSGA